VTPVVTFSGDSSSPASRRSAAASGRSPTTSRVSPPPASRERNLSLSPIPGAPEDGGRRTGPNSLRGWSLVRAQVSKAQLMHSLVGDKALVEGAEGVEEKKVATDATAVKRNDLEVLSAGLTQSSKWSRVRVAVRTSMVISALKKHVKRPEYRSWAEAFLGDPMLNQEAAVQEADALVLGLEPEDDTFREQVRTAFGNVVRCARGMFSIIGISVLATMLSTLPMCFLLEAEPGNTLLSGLFRYGTLAFPDLDCAPFANATTCEAQETAYYYNATSNATFETVETVPRTSGLTEFADDLNFFAIRCFYVLDFVAVVILTSAFAALMFWNRVKHVHVIRSGCLYVVNFLVLMGFYVRAAMHPGLFSLLPCNMSIASTGILTLLYMNSKCAEDQKCFRSWTHVAWFLFLFVVIFTAIIVVIFLPRYIGPSEPATLIGVAYFVSAASEIALLEIVKRIPHLPIEASAAIFFLPGFVISTVIRVYVASIDDIAAVSSWSGFQTVIEVVRSIIMGFWKRYCLHSLKKQGRTRAYRLVRFLAIVDLLTDSCAEVLAIFVTVPPKLIADPHVFDLYGKAPCKTKANLTLILEIFSTQLGFEAVADLFSLMGMQWIIGPFNFDFVMDTASSFWLALFSMGLSLYCVTIPLALQLRHGCLFCDAQVLDGDVCLVE